MEPFEPFLVFDGDCAICTTSADWLARTGRVRVVPWQRLDLASYDLDLEAVTTSVQWVGEGAPVPGARAVARALRARGGVWRAPGRVLTLPLVLPLAEVAYRWVARNRHRLPGGTPACALPPR